MPRENFRDTFCCTRLTCSIVLVVLLLPRVPATARVPGATARVLQQIPADVAPIEVQTAEAATLVGPAAGATEPAAVDPAIAQLAAVDPTSAQPAPEAAPVAPTELTAEVTDAAAAAAVDVPIVTPGLTELPQPDAVTMGLAADGTVYSPAVEAASAGPTVQHIHKSKKLYLYAWCGVTYANMTGRQPEDNDYVATIDATPGSTNFGKILSITNTPYVGTEAHHCNVDKTGKWLGAGGLLSFLKGAPDIFMFDLSKPDKPRYKYGLTSSSGSCMDEFIPHKNGGFVVSSMCARDGHTGGGVVRIPDPSTARMYEYSGGVTGADLASHASHGVDIDYRTNRMVTADYIDVASALSEAKLMHTASVWDTTTMKVLKKVDLSGITDGLMEARYTGVPGLFWVSGGMGKLHLINAKTFAKTPNVYCLSSTCETVAGTCLTTDTFDGPRGRRMLVTSMSLAQMRLVDVTNPYKLKTLDTYKLPEGFGAHVVKFDANTWTAALATYLLDIPGTVLHFPSDQSVRLFYIDLYRDKIVAKDKVDAKGSSGVIDFKTAVPSKGPGNCHGLAFNYV